jgi:hypothetical protein
VLLLLLLLLLPLDGFDAGLFHPTLYIKNKVYISSGYFEFRFGRAKLLSGKVIFFFDTNFFLYIHNIYAHNIFRNAKALQHIRRSQKERYVGGAWDMRDDGYSLS